MFMMLEGYIDESYSRENPPQIFSLTCTIARGNEWAWIEMAWRKCLEEKNAALIEQGRTPISRYHSVDINNFREEFTDWDGPERKEFCEKLVKVFARHEIGYDGYLINLQTMAEVWPEAKEDLMGSAYHILLRFLMLDIGEGINLDLPDEKIVLFHDRCNYDGVLLDAFNRSVKDPTFRYAKYFTTIAPMGWEDCIPLQPADLVAYENFKEGYRHLDEAQRPRRKIFSELLSLDSFAPHLRFINRENIIKLKGIFDAAKS